MREECAATMTANDAFTGIGVAVSSWTFHASAIVTATAAIAAPRKRHAAAGTTAASVNRGSN